MPRRDRPPAPCSSDPSCPELVQGGGPCARHRAEAERRRGTSADRGYDARWRRFRDGYLRRHPCCRLCGRPSSVPDHWPRSRRELAAAGVADPDQDRYLRPLCRRCHSAETAKHQPGGFRAVRSARVISPPSPSDCNQAKQPMPAERRTTVEAWLTAVMPMLGLDHWRVRLQDQPSDEHTDAQIHAVENRWLAHLLITDNWDELTPDQQAEVLVHELLHLHQAVVDDTVATVEAHVAPAAWSMYQDSYNRATERWTDQLAHALVAHQLVPPYPLPAVDPPSA